jgi:predicted HD phosphohydrolase
LLHDLGHLLKGEDGRPVEPDADRDDLHQFVALPFLRSTFDDAVLEPIRLHVDAKRYLCQSDPGYLATLSPASVHSLALQGGVFSADEAAEFLRHPHALTAARLRRYDDLAKVPGAPTPSLAHYLDVMRLSLAQKTRPPARQPLADARAADRNTG